MNTFCHLHVHTEHSLLDGAIKIPELIQKIKEYGMNACSISDHGYMGGVIKFYKECKKNNIIPLIGIEVYCTDDPDDIEDNKDKTKDNYHMVLIAKNTQGYKDLLRLSSEAMFHNFYYKPRIYIPKLEILKGNVVATTACLASFISKYAEWNEDTKQYIDKEERALNKTKEIASLFKEGDFYLELQDWDDGSGRQPAYNELLLEIGEKLNLPFVITTDAHYLNEEDNELHKIMMAMQFGQKLEEYLKGDMVYGPHFWIKPPEMMLASAKKLGCEEAFWNTAKIVDKCKNVEIELNKYYQPTFKIELAEDYKEYLEWKQNNDKRNNKM